MKQSLARLVDVILRRIEEQPDSPQSEKGLRSWLVRQGYAKRDIDAAMKLVLPRFQEYMDGGPPFRPTSVRALSPSEEHKLTGEARAALLRLEFYELVSPYERETILDRLNHFDGPVGMEELDYLLSWLVCGARDYESQQTIYGVLEGDGHTTLH
ncbi:MAG: DUF494 domain-containing protein [bacterium]|nr:DUF494 domain-containing protein [bacterium]